MKLSLKIGLAGAAVCAVLIAGGYYYWRPAHEAVVVRAPAALPSAMVVLTQREPMPNITPAPAPNPGPDARTSSLAADVDRLAKTGKPEDAFAAFRILFACQKEQKCGDLTPGQKTMTYNLLKQAVAAHVPKSSIYLLITTPDGRAPYEVYGDPAYDAWRADARREVADAAALGDVAALNQMATLSARDNKPDKAVAYWTAYMDKAPPVLKQINDQRAAMYAKGLSPEKVAAAVAEGHAMAGGTK